MNWPLTLGLLAAWIILPALAIIALKGRTLFGDRADELTDEHTENLGVGGGADFFQHGGSLTALGDNDHA